jgi:hypothetical protein
LTRAKSHELTGGDQTKRVTLEQHAENGGYMFISKDEPGEKGEDDSTLTDEIKLVLLQKPNLSESKLKSELRSASVKFGNDAFTQTLAAMVKSNMLDLVQHKQAKTYSLKTEKSNG